MIKKILNPVSIKIKIQKKIFLDIKISQYLRYLYETSYLTLRKILVEGENKYESKTQLLS